MQIRTFQKGDIKTVKDLIEQCRPYVTPHMDYHYWLLAEFFPEYTLLAEENGELAGYCGAFAMGHGPGRVFVIQLAVAPPYRKQGIGKALLEALYKKHACEGTGAFYLECTISPENIASQQTFRSLAASHGGRLEESGRVYEAPLLEKGFRVVIPGQLPCNLYLIGFMGVGKSTVAGFLGRHFSVDVVEMDGQIEKQAQMGIPEIFAVHGEAYFRKLETGFLQGLKGREHLVVSCGGGAALRECNVREMKKNGRIVLLDASPETVLERVRDSDARPLLNGNKNTGYIADLMGQRRERYEAAADFTIHTDKKTVEEICSELVGKLLGSWADGFPGGRRGGCGKQ